MTGRRWGAALAVLGSLAVAAPATADPRQPINAYRVQATPQNLEKLALAGFDVTEGRRGRAVEVFGTAQQARKLRAAGLGARLVRDRKGRTAAKRQRARIAQAGGGDAPYTVWRRFDRVDNDGKEQYLELYERLSRLSIVKRVELGRTHQDRPIIALKVTRQAKTTADSTRPAVLYSALQHAREWLAGETCRRTLDYVTSRYGTDGRVTRLVDTRELWFLCVANPDGYEYTFTPGNRLWRKNMADNDNDGTRGENGDGVDPNRNFPTNWGLDDEGSSSNPASETYRGTGPASEPETKAMIKLWERVEPAFQKNDHTAAELLLWPHGAQQFTFTPDNPIFEALAGDDAAPAIKGHGESFDPDVAAELYITNGETTDDAYHEHGILGYTPEGTVSRVPGVSGFEFEDDEQEVQEEFLRHRKFALDLAESAADPDEPSSHLGNTTSDFYVDAFDVSYGDPQPVQVLARRALGAVTMRYRVNGGDVRSASTSEFTGGERYGDPGVYYHRLRGTVTGTSPGDRVEVWFTAAGGERSPSFTYTAERESNHRVLVLADENYTGPTPAQRAGGPHYAGFYTAALAANGVAADVYDVDAHDTTAPHPLGVLSHYDAVVWETGDDYLTRRPGQRPGTGVARATVETEIAVRDYLNEGGKLLFAGQNAGRQLAEGFEFRNFGFPEPDEDPDGRWCWYLDDESKDGCIAHNNDFLQYHLGAYIYVSGGNAADSSGRPYPIAGTGADPFGSATFPFGAMGVNDHTATFAVTSSILDPVRFPTFADSRKLAGWQRPDAGPFAPYSGSHYMAAGADSEAFKRLRREVDLTGATSGELSFRFSADLEPDWDYMVVEAREVGTSTWTTLPDGNGHTTQATGDSCPEGWRDLHSQLDHYQTLNADGTCSPTGTTGSWHAFTGNSHGWQEWRVDLSSFAGKQVELSISVVTDWAVLGLGAWVDDARITVDGHEVAATQFEDDGHGWSLGPAPDGTSNPVVGWSRSTEQFREGAVVGTDDTVYAGFGLEGLEGADKRAEFMRGVLRHLGVLG